MSQSHTEVAISEMLKLDFQAEQIAKILQMSVEQVEEIINQLKN